MTNPRARCAARRRACSRRPVVVVGQDDRWCPAGGACRPPAVYARSRCLGVAGRRVLRTADRDLKERGHHRNSARRRVREGGQRTVLGQRGRHPDTGTWHWKGSSAGTHPDELLGKQPSKHTQWRSIAHPLKTSALTGPSPRQAATDTPPLFAPGTGHLLRAHHDHAIGATDVDVGGRCAEDRQELVRGDRGGWGHAVRRRRRSSGPTRQRHQSEAPCRLPRPTRCRSSSCRRRHSARSPYRSSLHSRVPYSAISHRRPPP